MRDPKTMCLGMRVQSARLAAGISTRAEFARRLGVDVRTVYRIERDVSRPSFETLRAIARETGCSVEHFTDDASVAA